MTAEFERNAAAAGIAFRLKVKRGLTIHGVEHGLVLHVWPETGFDGYRLPAIRTTWLGGMVTLLPLEELASHTRRN